MNKKNYSMNIGTSSILLIFVLLCLVSFAALSIVSANADNKLSTKVMDRNTAYYNACNEAEESLTSLDITLSNLYVTGISEDDYYAQVGHSASYVIPISDLQSLQVELDILFPKNPDEPFYHLTSWQVITTGQLDYDESLSVIQD